MQKHQDSFYWIINQIISMKGTTENRVRNVRNISRYDLKINIIKIKVEFRRDLKNFAEINKVEDSSLGRNDEL